MGESIEQFLYDAEHGLVGHPRFEELKAEVERLQAEAEGLTGQRDRLLDAGRRSLNWLSSYPGGGALGCYDEMRAAVDPLERVLTKD